MSETTSAPSTASTQATSAATSTPTSTPTTSSTSKGADYTPTTSQESQKSQIATEQIGEPSAEQVEQAIAKMYKVQIDGKEMEVDETELIKGYQRARASAMKFEEAARMRQQANRLLETLQKDPLSILTNEKLGINFDDIAERHLLRKLEDQMLSPEERAARDRDAKLKEYEAREQERQEQEYQRQFEQAKNTARQDYERRFIEVLDKVNIPKTADTVSRMARYMQEALRRGMEPDIYDVADLVKEDLQAEQRAIISAASDDKLEQILGQENVEKIRKSLLAKVQPQAQNIQPITSAKPAQKADNANTHMDEFEWKQYIRKKAGL